MKKKRTALTAFLVVATFMLLGSTFYISSLLSSSNSPTQIQKTKAAPVTYKRTVALAPFGKTDAPAPTSMELEMEPTIAPTLVPTVAPTLALIKTIPTALPTKLPTKIPTMIPTMIPTAIPIPSAIPATPTLSPLLAYKSTGGITPTLIPIAETGGMIDITKAPSPTKKLQPTGMQQLPQTGWIQTSSILFIVATSTILFSLLF